MRKRKIRRPNPPNPTQTGQQTQTHDTPVGYEPRNNQSGEKKKAFETEIEQSQLENSKGTETRVYTAAKCHCVKAKITRIFTAN